MTASDNVGRELGQFPLDDFNLDALEHALNTTIAGPVSLEGSDDGARALVGGDFTLPMLLDFMSGHDPERKHLIGYAGDIPIFESWDQRYSEHDVIRALVAEVRRLRASAPTESEATK